MLFRNSTARIPTLSLSYLLGWGFYFKVSPRVVDQIEWVFFILRILHQFGVKSHLMLDEFEVNSFMKIGEITLQQVETCQ